MQNLREKYPTIEGIQYPDISGYPPPEGNERIYFLYIHKNYLNLEKTLITIEQIQYIAALTFKDIGWKFHEEKGLMRNIVDFYTKKTKSEKKFSYQSRYMDHDIEFGILEMQLNITISTGNRGIATLHPKQRNNYNLFIDKIVEQTIINTR